MERLTTKSDVFGEVTLKGNGCTMGEVIHKLFEYEDLEEKMNQILLPRQTMKDFVYACVEHYELSKTKPEIEDAMLISYADSKKLKEYKDLEEQGLLHKAQFKIGQPIWIVGNELINDYVIRQFIVTENGIEAVKISKEINGKEYWNTFYTETWLVYVFPTKAEAEKALEEMEK